jgi:ABC-type transporter Mla subunit MlaD
MAKRAIEYILGGEWTGQGAVRAAKKGIGDVADEANDANTALSGAMRGVGKAVVGAAAAYGALNAARAVFDAARTGATLIEERRQLNALAASINTTGDAFAASLGESVGLFLSDAEQIRQGGNIIRLGLADSAEGASRLLGVTSKLKIDINDVAQSAASLSTETWDQMGINAIGAREEIRALIDQGIVPATAYMTVFMGRAEEAVEKQGGAAAGLEKSFIAIETVVENAGTAFDTTFAMAITGMADSATEADNLNTAIVTMAQNAAIALAHVVKGILLLGAGMANVRRETAKFELNKAIKEHETREAIGGVVQSFRPLNDAIAAGDELIAELGQEFLDATKTANMFEDAANAVDTSVESITASLSEVGSATTTAGMAIDETTKAVDAATSSEEDREAGIQTTISLLETETDQQEKLNDAMLGGKEVVDLSTGAMGGYSSSVRDAASAMREFASETGSAFDSLRRTTDFNPMEEVYKQLVQKGASAQMLRDFLVEAGLESVERADEILRNTVLRGSAGTAAEAYIAGGTAEDAVKIQQRAIDDPAAAAILGGGVVQQGGKSVVVNFYGDVIDEAMLVDLISEIVGKEFGGVGVPLGEGTGGGVQQ